MLLAAAAIPAIGAGAALISTDARAQSAVPQSWEPIQLVAATLQAPKTSTRDYVRKAALGDMFEIESSKLAAEKAQNKDVKAFAEQMIQEHTGTTKMLNEAVAKGNVGVTPPMQLDPSHAAKLNQLRTTSVANFDKMYVAMQTQAHEDALTLHQSYAQDGDNAELKETADDIADHVEAHLKDIKDIRAKDNL
jgi:putative membrane protein